MYMFDYIYALSRQVTMAEVFYNLRKKFRSGNFRHFKFPTFALGLTNRAPAKTLGASVIREKTLIMSWQVLD